MKHAKLARPALRQWLVAVAAMLIVAYLVVISSKPLPQLQLDSQPDIAKSYQGDPAPIAAALQLSGGGNGVVILSGTPADYQQLALEGTGKQETSGHKNLSIYESVSNEQVYSMASITKLITVLTVLEHKPLNPSQAGDTFTVSERDVEITQSVLRRNGVAAQAPIGQTFSEQDLLRMILLESANDLTISYAVWVFGSEAEFLSAAREYLANHGFTQTKIVEPTGLDARNSSTLHEVLRLGELALANPTIAAITRMPSAHIAGWGEIESTNWFVLNQGALGIKTGTLATDYLNILVAQDHSRFGREFTTYAITMGKPDDEARIAHTDALISSVDAALVAQPVLEPKAYVGSLTTWQGESVDLVSANTQTLSTVLMPNETASVQVVLEEIKTGNAGDKVGKIVVKDPSGSREVAVELADSFSYPSLWWRLTHPAEVLGF